MNTILAICSLVFISVWLPSNGFVLQSIPEHQKHGQQDGSHSSDYTIDLEIEDGDYEYEKDAEHSEDNFGQSEDSERTGSEDNKELISSSSNEDIGDRRSKATMQGTVADKSHYIMYVTTHPPPTSTKTLPTMIGNSDTKFNVLEFIKEYFSCEQCSSEDANGIGFRAIRCLLADYRQSRQPYDVLTVRLCNIVVIWLIVYLGIAIPLWCTKGWCCCCLYCKFFKPQETIQEAKNYLLLNPPGVLITKKGAIIHYEPTEREKDCYEEFGHFIRTL